MMTQLPNSRELIVVVAPLFSLCTASTQYQVLQTIDQTLDAVWKPGQPPAQAERSSVTAQATSEEDPPADDTDASTESPPDPIAKFAVSAMQSFSISGDRRDASTDADTGHLKLCAHGAIVTSATKLHYSQLPASCRARLCDSDAIMQALVAVAGTGAGNHSRDIIFSALSLDVGEQEVFLTALAKAHGLHVVEEAMPASNEAFQKGARLLCAAMAIPAIQPIVLQQVSMKVLLEIIDVAPESALRQRVAALLPLLFRDESCIEVVAINGTFSHILAAAETTSEPLELLSCVRAMGEAVNHPAIIQSLVSLGILRTLAQLHVTVGAEHFTSLLSQDDRVDGDDAEATNQETDTISLFADVGDETRSALKRLLGHHDVVCEALCEDGIVIQLMALLEPTCSSDVTLAALECIAHGCSSPVYATSFLSAGFATAFRHLLSTLDRTSPDRSCDQASSSMREIIEKAFVDMYWCAAPSSHSMQSSNEAASTLPMDVSVPVAALRRLLCSAKNADACDAAGTVSEYMRRLLWLCASVVSSAASRNHGDKSSSSPTPTTTTTTTNNTAASTPLGLEADPEGETSPNVLANFIELGGLLPFIKMWEMGSVGNASPPDAGENFVWWQDWFSANIRENLRYVVLVLEGVLQAHGDALEERVILLNRHITGMTTCTRADTDADTALAGLWKTLAAQFKS